MRSSDFRFSGSAAAHIPSRGRTRRLSILAICAVVLAIALLPIRPNGAFAAVESVPVANAGFESDLQGWTQTSGPSAMVSISTSTAHGGGKSLRIADTSTTAGVTVESDLLPAVGNVSYAAGAAFTQTGRTAGYAKLTLVFFDSAQAPIAPAHETSATATNGGWQELGVSAVSPLAAKYVAVRVGTTSGYVSTAAHYDDVTLTLETPDTLANPGFETGDLSGWARLSGSAANLTIGPATVHEGSQSLQLNDPSATSALGVESQKLDASEGLEYAATAFVNVVSGSASIYLRFYSATGDQLSQVSGAATAASPWQPIGASATAPAGTRFISVVLFSSSANIGVSHWDSVALGVPVPVPGAVALPLVNHGFESSLDGWQVKVGAPPSVTSDATRSTEGSRSLLIADTSAGESFTVEGARELAAPGVAYTVSAQFFQTNRTASRGYLWVNFYDAGRNLLGSVSGDGPTANQSGTNWVGVSATEVAPPGTKYVSASVTTTSAYTGRLWVDDVRLTVLSEPDPSGPSDAAAVAADADAIGPGYLAGDDATSVTGALELPAMGPNETVIRWSSSHPEVISRLGAVVRPAADQAVELSAEVVRGAASETVTFSVTAKARSAPAEPIGPSIANPGFEQGLDGWEQTVGATAAITATTPGSSGSAVRIAESGTDAVVLLSAPMAAERQMAYTLVADVEVAAGDASVELRFYDVNDDVVLVDRAVRDATSSTWKQTGVRAIAPQGTGYLRVALVKPAGAAADFRIDDVQVTGGDFAQPNRGFEQGDDGWTVAAGDGSATADDDDSFSGESSLHLVGGSGSAPTVDGSEFFAEPGDRFAAFAKVKIASGTARIALNYFDDDDQLLHSETSDLTAPIGEWTELGAKAEAPAGTAKATVGVAVLAGSDVRFDDVYLTTEFTYLGAPINLEYIQTAAVAKDPSGRDLAYSVVGDSKLERTNFVGVDVLTEELVVQIPLPSSQGAFTMLAASDGNVYFGSYSEGRVYKYTPGADAVEDLGVAVPGEGTLFALADGGNGVIYGGTYPSAYVFKYEPGSGFSTIGPNGVGERFDDEEQYVRGLAVDRAAGVMYAGIGSQAKLIRYDLDTGDTQSVLPAAYDDNSFVYHVRHEGGKIFASVNPDNRVLVLSEQVDGQGAVTMTVDAELPDTLSVSAEIDGKVYYVRSDQSLHVYDLASKVSTAVTTGSGPMSAATSPVMLSAVELTDQAGYPGVSLVGMGAVYKGKTGVFVYTPDTNALRTAPVELPETSYNPRSLVGGPDGAIYTSNHLGGGTGVYQPLSGTTTMHPGLSQVENGVALDGKLYFGTYPKAKIMEYDPTQPWDLHTGGNNPGEIFELSSEYRQDRPFGAASGDGMVFIGTVPDYGRLGGVLAIWEPGSSSEPVVVDEPVADQSVVALAYQDGVVYGGTSVWGGLGIEPTATDAKFFAYDVDTGTKLFERTIAAGKRIVSSVEVGPDGRIWGMAEGVVFVYDPATDAFTYTENVFPELNYSARTSPVLYAGQLVVGDDGFVYGNTTGKFFRIDPATMQAEVLRAGSSFFIEKDAVGNIYYADSYGLWRYAATD